MGVGEWGVRLGRINSRLPLTSKLDALCAEFANPCIAAQCCVRSWHSLSHKIINAPHIWGAFIMAERMGFEPMIPVRVYTISSRAP